MSTEPGAPDIDWEELRIRAAEAAARAYAPYSHLAVGAAAVTEDGSVVTGCNVENASYGLTLCAECALVGDLRRQGHSVLRAVAATTPDGVVLMPCGRCRQILFEFGGATLLVDSPDGPKPLGELLAFAFGPDDLP